VEYFILNSIFQLRIGRRDPTGVEGETGLQPLSVRSGINLAKLCHSRWETPWQNVFIQIIRAGRSAFPALQELQIRMRRPSCMSCQPSRQTCSFRKLERVLTMAGMATKAAQESLAQGVAIGDRSRNEAPEFVSLCVCHHLNFPKNLRLHWFKSCLPTILFPVPARIVRRVIHNSGVLSC
jgi:hypothetical protein